MKCGNRKSASFRWKKNYREKFRYVRNAIRAHTRRIANAFTVHADIKIVLLHSRNVSDISSFGAASFRFRFGSGAICCNGRVTDEQIVWRSMYVMCRKHHAEFAYLRSLLGRYSSFQIEVCRYYHQFCGLYSSFFVFFSCLLRSVSLLIQSKSSLMIRMRAKEIR